jgi:NAD(P)-dependent dehydrogenase (short-subunit alcohol dehydrogenase family)
MRGTVNPATCFITGGMSGLGYALACKYLGRGADLAIFDLSCDEGILRALEKRRQRDTQAIVAFPVDVTDSQGLAEAVDQAVHDLAPPVLAINSAGMQRANPFEALSSQHFDQVVRVNLCGSRNFAAAVLPHMEAGARLALVASLAGFSANYSYAAYSASKFGVIGLGRVLRLEYKPRGIAVSLVCPPEVDTPMVEEEMKTMHPVSRRLKDFGGSLSVEEAVAGILAGLDAGRDVIIPGTRAKLTYLCSRYLPDALMNRVVDRIVASELAKLARAGEAANP